MNSARFDMVVRGGQVFLDGTTISADVGISRGRIAAIEQRLEDAASFHDAEGLLVLPGGVDSHCHMDQPSYGAVCADDFESGSLSAAFGGNTTIIPFAMASPRDSLPTTVASYRDLGERKSYIDFAIHPTIQSTSDELIERQLPDLMAAGYASIKLFTTYDGFHLHDGQVLAVMQQAAKSGGLVMVHAESDALIAYLTSELVKLGCHAPRFHGAARPALAEVEAIHRIASFASITGARVLIVHVTSREALDEIKRAQAAGIRIWAETCPQYLFLTSSELDRPLPDAAKFLCSPPLREEGDQKALWRAMADGSVTIYSSDHSPYRLEGPGGKLPNGNDVRFDRIPNGMPGLELRLPLLFSEGYLTGRLSLGEFVALASSAAAQLHGIAPRKGEIRVGGDADLAIWNPDRETAITHRMLHDRTGYTPYEGRRIRGWPVTVISRGEVIVHGGEMLRRPGRGLFVASHSWPIS